MAEKKPEHFSLKDIQDSSTYVIENFIMSSKNYKMKDFTFEHPFIFDGMIFGICLRGTAQIQINYKEHTLKENSSLTIPPDQIVQFLSRSENFRMEVLAFAPDYLFEMPVPTDYDIPKKILLMPVLDISGKNCRDILNYHQFIVTVFNNKKHLFFTQEIRGLLYSLMIKVMAIYADKENPVEDISTRRKEIVDQFITLLRVHHKQERNATFYADKLCITIKYLSETLKKITGDSINTWMGNAVIISAKIMLKSTELTIVQISDELNFPNPSYFGRFFKRLTGMTPMEYREKT